MRALPLPAMLDDLVDQRLAVPDLWGNTVRRLVDVLAGAGTPERALFLIQAHLVAEYQAHLSRECLCLAGRTLQDPSSGRS